MATRRMISRSLIDTDIFLDLSTEAKALYLFFNIYADDDGMVGNPKSISRISGISASFINELSECGYIIRFNSGVIAIKHWLVHNLIRKDRYTPTLFKKEYDCLCVNENNEYFIKDTNKPETKISPCESAAEVSDTSDNAVTEVEEEVDNAVTEVEKEVENAETEVENFFNNAATQVRIGKDRLNKVSLGKESEREKVRACAQSPPHPQKRKF